MILTLIFSLQIVLCRVEETQLDLVYPLTFQQNAAICQCMYRF